MTAVALGIVNFPSSGLLLVEAKFGVGLAALDVARQGRANHDQRNQDQPSSSRPIFVSRFRLERSFFSGMDILQMRLIHSAGSRFTMIDANYTAQLKLTFPMSVAIKRVYEPATRADGNRVLVDRLWPRGLSKERAAVHHWMRELSPPTNSAVVSRARRSVGNVSREILKRAGTAGG